MEAGRTAEAVGREMGVPKAALYAWKAKDAGLEVSEASQLVQTGGAESVAEASGVRARAWIEER